MKSKTFKVDTWLPIFSGFYGTIWESDSMEEMEFENINEYRKENKLSPIEWDAIEWDYAGYRQAVSEYVTGAISQKLEMLGCIQKGKFQKLISPREYNFGNDSINVQFTLNPANVKAAETYLTDNKEAFEKYLKERYTSRDGFISSYSNRLEDWLTDIDSTVGDAHKLGAVLNFILLTEEGEDYEMSLYEHATSNGCTVEAKNYKELMEVNP